MAAFAVVVGALHEHLAHVALRHSARKEQRAQSQGKVLCRTAALPSWSFVACELVRLLQQFPSGVSEAVIYTHVVERWSAQAGPRGVPSSQANGRCVSLAAVLAASEHDAAPATEARVAAVEAREGWPLVLLLRDGSVDAPLGLYVHSRWLPLCAGPRPLVAGAALLLDGLLRELSAEALEPLPAAGQRCAVGAALHALVARVDAPQAGFDSAHGLASRTGAWRLVWLAAPAGAGEDGHVLVALRLVDEQVTFGDVLAEGETVVLAHALLTADQPGPGARSACLEARPRLCRPVRQPLMTHETLVCVVPRANQAAADAASDAAALDAAAAAAADKENWPPSATGDAPSLDEALSKSAAQGQPARPGANEPGGLGLAADPGARAAPRDPGEEAWAAPSVGAAGGSAMAEPMAGEADPSGSDIGSGFGLAGQGALIGRVTAVELSRRTDGGQALLLRMQAGGECANVRVAVDGPSRRHALALRPGHVAALTGLRAVPAAAAGSSLGSGPAAATPLSAAAPPDGEPMDVDAPARLYEWREDAPDAAVASLSALPALLASPAFPAAGLSSLAAVLHSGGRGAAACGTLAAADTGCNANPGGGPGPGAGLPALHLCEVELAGLPAIALRRAHAPCGRWLRVASLDWGGMFDSPGAAPAAGSAPGAGSSSGACSGPASGPAGAGAPGAGGLWTCALCGVDCGAAAAPLVFDISMELADATGCTRAKAAGEAAATLVGVFPAQWAAWTAPEQAAHLRAHALGRRLLVSLCAEQGSLQVAGLRRLDE